MMIAGLVSCFFEQLRDLKIQSVGDSFQRCHVGASFSAFQIPNVISVMVGLERQLLLSQPKVLPPSPDGQADLAANLPLLCLNRAQRDSVSAGRSYVCPQKVVFEA